MRARITCDDQHPLGRLFSRLFDIEFYSRRTGFDLHNQGNVDRFLSETSDYDWTINMSRGMQFGGVKLLCSLEEYCHAKNVRHKVLNIGSYINMLLLNYPTTTYDVEKAALKVAHRKVTYAHTFHDGRLDSYLLSFNHIEEMSVDIKEHYKHLNVLSLDDTIDNVKFMLDNPSIKEMTIQYKQPGNHRVNDGIGLILPGVY